MESHESKISTEAFSGKSILTLSASDKTNVDTQVSVNLSISLKDFSTLKRQMLKGELCQIKEEHLISRYPIHVANFTT